MSSPTDDAYELSMSRDISHAYDVADHYAPQRVATAAETVAAAPANEAVKITLSPEAKAAMEGIREKTAEREQASQRAKEIAAVSGVSEAEAVHIAQPTRSPPPAKGAALMQANLTAENSGKD